MADEGRWDKKDPGDAVPYSMGWEHLLEEGETITGATWTIPDGITKVTDSIVDTDTVAKLSGGEADVDYPITCSITTSGGNVLERTRMLKVREL